MKPELPVRRWSIRLSNLDYLVAFGARGGACGAVVETVRLEANVVATKFSGREQSLLFYSATLLMHWPNPSVPLEETLGAMRELQEEGSVKHVGVSNFSPSMVEEATQHAEIFCNQVEYHPYRAQEELLEQAREMDYLLTAYSPVAGGAAVNDATLREIGEAHGKTPPQVALRWLIHQEKVAAIPKAASRDHLKSNFDIFDFELSDEEMERVCALRR